MIQNKKYFCYEIYKNISVVSHNNKIQYSPCCWYAGHTHESTHMDIDTAIASEKHQALKHLVESDQPVPGCHKCYHEEENGRKSRRISAKINYEDFVKDTNIDGDCLTGLDYSLGNLCNLKCVICGPWDSSSWLKDWKQLYPKDNRQGYKKEEQVHLESDQIPKNLKYLHMHGGGEPLMADHHIKILNACTDLSQIRVAYNTNATLIPNNDVIELWKKCKLIELYFSIDALDIQYEYQRTNGKWPVVVDNIEWYKVNMPHNHMFNINCVWSAMNIYYLDQLVDWKKQNLDTNRYGDPVNLIFQKALGKTAISHIRPIARDKLYKKYEHYPELLSMVKTIPIKDEPLVEFERYINKLDKIRGVKYADVHPEWAQLIGVK